MPLTQDYAILVWCSILHTHFIIFDNPFDEATIKTIKDDCFGKQYSIMCAHVGKWISISILCDYNNPWRIIDHIFVNNYTQWRSTKSLLI